MNMPFEDYPAFIWCTLPCVH